MDPPRPQDIAAVDQRIASLGVVKQAKRETTGESDARYRGLLEAAPDAMVVVNQAGDIVLVNLQAEKRFGYSRDELVGQPVTNIIPEGFAERLIADDLRSAADALAQQIGTGIELSGRRKDGTEFPIEIMLSPLESAGGILVTAAIRDISVRKAAENQRALIGDTLRGLRPGDTPEATAQATCRQVVRLSGVTAAQIFIFELDGRAMPIGFTLVGAPDPPLRRLPSERSEHLRGRAAEGPWIEPWVPRRWHPYNDLLTGLGPHLVAYAPVRSNNKLIGLLVIDAAESVDERALSESLPALVEFADVAAALIGRDVAERTEASVAREHILSIIETAAFESVFQAIVDLETDAVIGYEGLTRFTDGVSPNVRFAEATAVGLGPELEAATLKASLAAATALPGPASLNLNVSPALIMARQPLQELVRKAGRPIVLEVTEHAQIADYEAFRASFAMLRPKMELAVDDAGAGFASLRHILELRPAFVKLDRSLIAGLESDKARQAMIVGLRHFARSVGCRLIAEGIETVAELEVLRTLEIRLAQGFLLGRPRPITEHTRASSSRSLTVSPGAGSRRSRSDSTVNRCRPAGGAAGRRP